jgi:hypothetical protein
MPAIKTVASKPFELEYLLVCKDGSRARGPTLETTTQRIKRITNSPVMMSFLVHPDTKINSFGYIEYPDGYPPEEITYKKGKEWTAADSR